MSVRQHGCGTSFPCLSLVVKGAVNDVVTPAFLFMLVLLEGFLTFRLPVNYIKSGIAARFRQMEQ